MEEGIHAVFKKFPQHADRHRKAKGHQRHVQRREAEFFLLIAAQDIHQRKPERRAHKAIDGMQHRIPIGKLHIVVLQLAKDLGRKYEQQYDDLQHRRQLYTEVF